VSYTALEQCFREIGHLDHALAMLGWDEAVMMPTGGGEARADALAALAAIRHERLVSPRVGDLLAATRPQALDDWQAANLREMQRAYRIATALESDLVAELARASTRCEQVWRTARAANDWEAVVTPLERVVQLTREKAQRLATARSCAPYDALLELYQPGISQATIAPIFDDLEGFLPPFLERVLEFQARLPRAGCEGQYPIARQAALGRELMTRLGFDFGRGRFDTSHHPFCGGQPDDVRLTTRYVESDFFPALMGTLHETGHALYEQGLPARYRGQPVGEAGGMAVHESQSLLIEMQVCRGRPFLRFAAPLIAQHLGVALPVDTLYRVATRVERGYIRVDADEVTYPLHVILRHRLEPALLAGSLAVRDLPEVWDVEMHRLLGLATRGNDRDGCMQDVHWFAGLIGYFPCYTLGALMAAQIFARIRAEVPDVETALAEGSLAPVLDWLRRHIHGRGRLVEGLDLIAAATGEPLGTAAFKAHLEARYLAA
jgi:carboxypeptidase Taq